MVGTSAILERVPAGLRHRWRGVARPLGVAATLATLSLFVVSLPFYFNAVQSVCLSRSCRGEAVEPATVESLQSIGLSLDFYAAYFVLIAVAYVLAFSLPAVLIFRRRSDDGPALFVAFTLVLFGASWAGVTDALARSHPAWTIPTHIPGNLGLACVFLLCYVFPDGRFVPRWTRLPAIVGLVFAAQEIVAPSSEDAEDPPLVILVFLAFVASCAYAQIYRYRKVADRVQRQQIKLVVFAVTLIAVGTTAAIGVQVAFPELQDPGTPRLLFSMVGDPLLEDVPRLLLPAAVGIAIMRYRLFDIDVLINRALVYGALTAGVVALYVLVVGGIGALFRTTNNLLISLAATGLVAVLFHPMRDRLQRGVNHLLYGERDDPYVILTRLGQRLDATLAPEAVLPTIVQTLAEALRLPYTAIALDDGEEPTIAATYGVPVTNPVRVPLVYQHQPVGELLLGPRAPGEAFSTADLRLVDDVAHQIGVAAHAVRLTADLQRSRELLVTTREEERRRLRRDLHDGLGPLLGGLALKLDAARRLMHQDLEAADLALSDLKAQTQTAIGDIRRLAYALRPPALDELGLSLALRDAASRYDTASQDGPSVTVEVPDQLPPLPAAVEVATYFIAQEALTNVVRHAEAHHCRIQLSADDVNNVLNLEIRDDGRGLPDAWRSGVGLAAMRERAAELGGVCTIDSNALGGTVVRARLPCPMLKTPIRDRAQPGSESPIRGG